MCKRNMKFSIEKNKRNKIIISFVSFLIILLLVSSIYYKIIGYRKEIKNSFEGDIMFWASAKGHPLILNYLLYRGDNPNRYSNGITALHIAANANIASILSKYGANINASSLLWPYFKPIQIASKDGRDSVVLWLLKHGANINSGLDENAPTPLCFASLFGHNNTVDILLNQGEKLIINIQIPVP